MTDPEFLPLMLVVLFPIYGFTTARMVGEFFAERPLAWEWTKVVIDVVCFLIIIGVA